MSIEPLSFDIAPLLVNSPLEWAVIGAATNGKKAYQPRREWVENVLDILDAQGTKIFFKGNLKWKPWREEFPEALTILPIQIQATLVPESV
jgi:protein gp37